ncbi:MAG: hypothetical protein WCR52_10290 [Bacteroidota bacterium]|uniref:hypothetical protein n=1 Tax=Runella sp. TaxID=1960881 RepID=UPI003019F175
MKPITSLTILFCCIVFVSCENCRLSNNCFKDYKFAISYKFYPAQDTFRIGDTIWLESHIPAMLYDSISGQEYSLGDFEHKIYGALDIFDNPAQWLIGSRNFDYFSLAGTCVRGKAGNGSVFNFIYNDSDSLRFAVIPTQKGLYSFGLSTLTQDYYTEKGFISKPCTETITMRFRTNNADSLNNYRLLVGYPNIWPTEKGFLSDGGYAFRVIE